MGSLAGAMASKNISTATKAGFVERLKDTEGEGPTRTIMHVTSRFLNPTRHDKVTDIRRIRRIAVIILLQINTVVVIRNQVQMPSPFSMNRRFDLQS